MKSVKKSGSSSLKVTWEAAEGAVFYELYVAKQNENAKYKRYIQPKVRLRLIVRQVKRSINGLHSIIRERVRRGCPRLAW